MYDFQKQPRFKMKITPMEHPYMGYFHHVIESITTTSSGNQSYKYCKFDFKKKYGRGEELCFSLTRLS